MCPRRPEQNEEIRHERMMQILHAALTIYVQKGYAAAEVADVAQEAGLARGLVYYYYNSKQELFQSLFEWMQENSRKFAEQILLHGDGKPVERLAAYARSICEGNNRDPRFTQFYMRAYQEANQVYGTNDSKYICEKNMIRDCVVTVIKQGVESGEIREGNPILAANAYWGALSMNLAEQMLQNICGGQKLEQDEISEIVSYCLFGLTVHTLN